MQKRIFTIGLILALVAACGVQLTVVSAVRSGGKAQPTRFKVRIENIASPEGQTASDGTKWPFAISPGAWVLDSRSNPLFRPGKKALPNSLEAQAEDGNPAMLVQSLEQSHHNSTLHGIFNTPVGATTPGPVTPGGAYEFTISATPGMRLSFTMMFGQSNDLFYAPDSAIAFFDAKGQPVSGDITSRLILWDAGTEVNQEPGIGPDQAPRQKAPNTGTSESKKIAPVKDGFTYPKTSEVLRVTITPDAAQ
ncbi:MAG: spondin domain-containing protein [Acidobacteria bacterium]|nr:spondin domain-containing protein [Acidobacteriota bacterium]